MASRTYRVKEQELAGFLEGTRGTVREHVLLDRFVEAVELDASEQSECDTDTAIELYRRHFELYNALYRLEDSFEQRGIRLSIGLAEVTILDVPDEALCRYFDESFCALPAVADGYCAYHRELNRSRAADVGHVGMRGYYLNPENRDSMDSDRLEMMMQGLFEYASNSQEIDNACSVLGLERSCSLERLKRRFHYLCSRSHPDAGGSSEEFTRLQEAYERLRLFRLSFEGPHAGA